MKRCPQCGREYDVSMHFCLDDGSELLYGPSSGRPDGGTDADQGGDQTRIFGAGSLLAHSAVPSRNSEESGTQPLNSIAVLPFANMSSDPDNEYFCDGLAEELLNALTKVEELKVAARTSAFSFKGRNTNVSDIAAALNVKTILEGSVRRSGNRIRITAQLVNAADGYQLWSERYDRELKDVFEVQDEIAVAVVEALKIKLLGSEKTALLKRHTRNAEAYEFYLRGLSHFSRWTPADFEKAIENFERAIGIDPEYASAYAALADAHTELLFFSFSSTEARSKARKAAETALRLDDTLAEAHNSLALIRMYFDWDYAAAEAEFQRALALNPGSSTAHMWYGWFLGLMGRFDEGLSRLRHARELDPLSPPNNNAIGVVLLWSGQTAAAVEQFHDVLELNPGYPVSISFLAEAYALSGDMAAALSTIEMIPRAAADPQALSVMGYVYARSGARDKAAEILDEFRQRSAREYVPALNFAHIYAGMDDNGKALDSLEKALDERAIWMPFLKVDTKLDRLRSEPRFHQLLRNAGFPY